ncbi:hypothetical protein G3570_04750 [Balneolaceae bacterium YR4-1]|uniref:Protein involved in polysaccharide export, contains SLBB domain of the beta-grasp fold n=1 Tax=Halalkalibaculum roseum TaxID=2709311 RepID=A0A6M1SKT9_9BACT|nr:SLBB domain-containing protein [Halalkalibaculum roseum]NGP75931.1 hypothetical protein [Halalkalibaculum roseum]
MGFKKQLFTRLTFVFSLLFIIVTVAAGQNVGDIDFENLRSSDLSDQQIERLWERAQSQGYTVSQIEQVALARGMAPSEVSRLVNRLREIRMQRSSDQQQREVPQLRRVTTDSLLLDMVPQDTLRDSTKTRIFGSRLFRSDKVTFTPSLNIPTPENYQLGPGDELVIDIWGAAEQTYRLTVSPEGTITIANLGPIYVNGLSIERARDRIKNELSKIYSGLQSDPNEPTDTQARISLGNIRSIKVTVLGEARFPGTYTLPSLATVFNALYSAGGPDSTGTFREIDVIRGDSVAATLDIYDFLVYGNQEDNIRLRDQDIIKIDPYNSRVEVEGYTKRTGIFELREGETIQDLLTFAGGFADNAYTRSIKIVSNTPTEKRIDDIRYPERKDFVIKNGSKVSVGKVLERFANRVEIQGAVFREGFYELNDTTSLYSLIQRAEGLRGDAFMNRGLIYREQEDYTIEGIPFSVQDVMNDPEQYDIPLQKNDIVQISSIFDLREDYHINVLGAVQQPGEFPYVENMTLEDVILQADGFKESAAPYRIEVSRRINHTDSAYVPTDIAKLFQFRVSKDLSLSNDGKRFIMLPFDRVFVRSSPAYYEQEDVTINGEVLFPGKYTLSQKTTRISDLIERAGGLTQYAYAQGANLTRQIEGDVDQEFINIPDSLKEENTQRNRTKVGIRLGEILDDPGSKYNLILREGDVLEIPKELQTVRIAGEVLYPISVRYEKGRSFKEYIRAAGGASELGRPKDAYVVYANGTVDRANRFLFFRNYPKVQPGATIFVPEKEQRERLSTQERIGILSAIVSMAAIVSNTIFQIRR